MSKVEVRLMRRTSSSGSMRWTRFSELKELLKRQILSAPLMLLKAASAPLLMLTWIIAHRYTSLSKLSCRRITTSTFTSRLLWLLEAKLATHAAKALCWRATFWCLLLGSTYLDCLFHLLGWLCSYCKCTAQGSKWNRAETISYWWSRLGWFILIRVWFLSSRDGL